MTTDTIELVIDATSSATIHDLVRLISESKSKLEAVHLVGDSATIGELLATYLGRRIRISGETAQKVSDLNQAAEEPTGSVRVSVEQEEADHLEPPPSSNTDSQAAVDGGRVATGPPARNYADGPPLRGDYIAADDWVADTARYLGVEFDALAEVAIDLISHTRATMKRDNLELAFSNHLDRETKGEDSFVEIRFKRPVRGFQYRYLDNGRGRGGAHYLQDLDPRIKEDIRRLAVAAGMTVFAEGDTFLSVGLVRTEVKADIQFADQIMVDVFGGSLSDIRWIFEVVDREPVYDWWFD